MALTRRRAGGRQIALTGRRPARRGAVLRWAGNAAAALVGIVGAVSLGEALVRCCTDFEYTAPRIFMDSAIIPWELRPGVRAIDQGYWREFHVTVTTNRLGYRDREFTVPRPRGTVRLLVMGDSFTFGYGVENHEAYPKVLEQLLNRDGDPSRLSYEVINAGYASGYAPDTAFTYFRHRGAALSPDVVLLGFFEGNDIFDMTQTEWLEPDGDGLPRRVTSRAFYVDDHGRLRSASWLGVGAGLQHPWLAPLRELKAVLRDQSQFLNFVTQRYRLFWIARGSRLDDAVAVSREDRGRAYEKLAATLAGLRRLTAASGARFAVISIPEKPVTPEAGFAPASAFISDWCRRHGVPLVDLGQTMAGGDARALYFPIDPHWNRSGHAEVALRLHRFLHAHGLTTAAAPGERAQQR